MYGKFEKSILLCVIIITILLFLAVSCVSRRTGIDNNILSHQREIDRLEEELRNRDRAVENAVRELEAITSRSTEMVGGVRLLLSCTSETHWKIL